MTGKAPAFQFYPSDWLRDLDEHPLEIEGAWIRIISKMWWEPERGKMTRTTEQWARILKVDEPRVREILNYIARWNIGEIQECNADVTVICKRMYREHLERVNGRRRVNVTRMKRLCNANVTPPSSSSSSSSSSNIKSEYKNTHIDGDLKTIILQWNEFAKAKNLPVIKGIEPGSTRAKRLKARMVQDGFSFQALLEAVSASPFLLGENKSGWTCTFDWIIAPSNYQKIMEGNYRANKGGGAKAEATVGSNDDPRYKIQEVTLQKMKRELEGTDD